MVCRSPLALTYWRLASSMCIRPGGCLTRPAYRDGHGESSILLATNQDLLPTGLQVMAGFQGLSRRKFGLDAGKRLAQRVKTHSAQAECPGVKVLEAEGSSGSCHGILPGLEPDPFTKGV